MVPRRRATSTSQSVVMILWSAIPMYRLLSLIQQIGDWYETGPHALFQHLYLAPSPSSSTIREPDRFTVSDAVLRHRFFDAQSSLESISSRCAYIPTRRFRRCHPSAATPEIGRSDASFHDFVVAVYHQNLTGQIVRATCAWGAFGNEQSSFIVN